MGHSLYLMKITPKAGPVDEFCTGKGTTMLLARAGQVGIREPNMRCVILLKVPDKLAGCCDRKRVSD